jgi:hypothetical protein
LGHSSTDREVRDITETDRKIDEEDRGQRKNWDTATQIERLET